MNDDEQIGRILNRREALALLGSAALLAYDNFLLRPAFAGAPSGSCIVRPEQYEGPFFVDEKLNRSDIRSDPSSGKISPGIPLELALTVQQLAGEKCSPLAGAMVDIWHCDAEGRYSDETDSGFDTTGQKFLRGYQMTDANGLVRFKTIYPGWYPGRTVHVHIKIRTAPGTGSKKGREFTSQMYFQESISDSVHALPPYSKNGKRTDRNADDSIYQDGGDQLMLDLSAIEEGYRGSLSFTLV